MELVERHALRQTVKGCTRCDLGTRAGVTPVPFSGPTPAQLAIVGEAPGVQENTRGEPFVGPAGQLLRGYLLEAGFDLGSIMFVNTVSCWPKLEGTPSADHRAACRGLLFAQLRAGAAPYVLALGNVSLGALHPNPEPIGKCRGLWWQMGGEADWVGPRADGARVWATAAYHPAAVLRGGSRYEGLLRQDLEYVRVMVKEGMEPELGGFCVKCGGLGTRWVDWFPYCDRCHPPKRKWWTQEPML